MCRLQLEIVGKGRGLQFDYDVQSFGVRRLVYQVERPYRSGVRLSRTIIFDNS